MKPNKFILAILASLAILTASCAAISNAKDVAVGRVVDRIAEYCGTTTPVQRDAYRSEFDKGNGPVIEIYCDRM
jgi:hypothetical protein